MPVQPREHQLAEVVEPRLRQQRKGAAAFRRRGLAGFRGALRHASLLLSLIRGARILILSLMHATTEQEVPSHLSPADLRPRFSAARTVRYVGSVSRASNEQALQEIARLAQESPPGPPDPWVKVLPDL